MQTIVTTGHATIESAIAATRNGARDDLLKPFEIDELRRQVAESDQLLDLRRDATSAPGGLVSQSAAMRRVFASIETAAATTMPILVEGETGTGKELAASAIHLQPHGHPSALRQSGGNRAQAAKLLQMNRTALFKMKKLNIRG